MVIMYPQASDNELPPLWFSRYLQPDGLLHPNFLASK